MKRHPGLLVTALAVLFLLLDGLLLVWVGLAFGDPLLAGLGVAFLISSFLIVVVYRRYLRSIEELRVSQGMLRVEMEHLLQSVRDGGANDSNVSSLLES